MADCIVLAAAGAFSDARTRVVGSSLKGVDNAPGLVRRLEGIEGRSQGHADEARQHDGSETHCEGVGMKCKLGENLGSLEIRTQE